MLFWWLLDLGLNHSMPKIKRFLSTTHNIVPGHCTGHAGNIGAICVLCFVALVRQEGGRAVPLLGQHTREILKDWAGLDDQTLDGLINSEACIQA